jgi:NAD(P)H-quinone oxidoreductase subunit 5
MTVSTPRKVTVLVGLVWLVFLGTCGLSYFTYAGWIQDYPGDYVLLDGLVQLSWPYITFLTALILSFSRRYLAGDSKYFRFFLYAVLFMVSVMGFAAVDHFGFLLVFWVLMGAAMALLIAHQSSWRQAQASGRLAIQYFLAGGFYLLVGCLVAAMATDTWALTEGVRQLAGGATSLQYVVVICVLMAAFIQSALFPVQNWLMSSMTAPTPASALMHAGFVNAGGILLTRFAPLLVELEVMMAVTVVVGAASAILGKIWKMVQPAFKRQLGCSTVGQMGFMMLQCGLGFFTAALAHLILHGFYKGYLFLGYGEAVERKTPHEKQATRYLPGLLVSGFWALVAGGIFVVLTGKGTHLDSGLVLTVVIVVAVLHASRHMLEGTQFPLWLRHLVLPVVFLGSTAVYALIYNGVSTLLADVPSAEAPVEFSIFHGVLTLLFLALYFVTDLKLFKKFERLYVWILNAGQPHPATIVSAKEEYHAHEKT